MQHKRVLVTGAAGFIGANLVRELIKRNHQIHIFTKKTTNLWRLKDIIPRIKLYNVPLEDPKRIQKAVTKIKPNIIYHLAASGSYPQQTDPFPMIKTNIIGTANLLFALAKIDYECFINTGSSSEYGFKTKPMKETDFLQPESFYAATKAAETFFCSVIGRSLQKPIITIRPFSVYGPYEEPTRLIPTIITNIIRNRPVKLTPKKARRDFIYVKDVVSCLTHIPKAIKKNLYGEVFNLGTGKQYSNEQVVAEIKKAIKMTFKIKRGAYENRSWDSSYWVADITKMESMFRWQPKYNLRKGIEETIHWFLNYEDFTKNYR